MKIKNNIILPIIILIFFMTGIVNISATIGNKPDFDIEISANPEEALEGEDITVNGLIKPKPFEAEVPPKEILLVLDTSGSMKNTVSKQCDKDRVRYCITHKTSENSHGGIRHNWQNDYCIEHNKSGNHYFNSTRINELKKACYKFIDSMKDIENLKIGVVTYSTSSQIKRDDNQKALIPANETDKLKNIIEKLIADGGTNTGEGLRKAVHLLDSSAESSINANKTVILMSDGIPTYYSYYKEGDKTIYYRDTTVESPKNIYVGGTGYSDDYGYSLEYSQIIGEKIKSKGYNAFSIGYGMDKEGESKMKSIHTSMSNNIDNFFQASDDAIEKVFSQIATEIKDSYPVTNISLEMKLSTGINLNIGGNKVDIPDITYKKISGSGITGKVRYEADNISFKFIIKSSKVGYQEVYQGAYIKFPWNGEEISIKVDKNIGVNIKPNELPTIQATLSSDSQVNALPGQEIKIKYNISADDFIYNDSNNSILNDVAIAIDTSIDFGSSNLNAVQNSLWNDLLNNNELKNSNTKYSIITYNNNSEVLSKLTDNINNLNDDVIKNIKISSYNNKNIGSAFSKINKVFEEGRQNAVKNLIIISSGNVDYTNEELNIIKDKGYNIISLQCKSNVINNLNKLHQDLNGNYEYYFSASDNNDIQNNKMKEIAKILKGNLGHRPYIFDAKLKINLGDKFTAKEGFESIDNGIVTIDIPDILYNNKGNGKYVSNEIEPIEFKVTVNEGKSGELKFDPIGNNKIIYNRLKGDEVSFTIKTPVVNVQQPTMDLKHGLYNGIVDNQLSITEGEETISNGTYATVAASGTIYSNNTNINLYIDKDIDINNVSNIKVFKYDNIEGINKLLPIESYVNLDDDSGNQNNYSLKILGQVSSELEIVIKYQVKIPVNQYNNIYTNNVLFNTQNSIFNIRSLGNEDELPELF